MRTRRRAKIHPYRVFFWSAAIVAGLLVLLDQRPFTLDAGDPALEGQSTHDQATGDVLVIVSADQIAVATAEGRLERSWAWVDLFEQEVGPVATSEIADVDGETLQMHRFAVLTSSACADPSSQSLVDELEAFVASGGVLVLELPQGRLRTTFGADGEGGWRRPDAITAAGGVSSEVQQTLTQVPLLTRFLGSTRPLPEAETLLAMDGAPVVYARKRGEGEVIVFDFELGAQLSRMQQGEPGADFRVAPRRHGRPVRTFDLASTPALLGAEVPYADLLERYVAHAVVGRTQPLFALWPYPKGRRGALITTHESRDFAGRPLWMSVHERDLGARSATHLSAPARVPPTDVPRADAEFVGHAALLWVLDPADASLYRTYGAFGFEPVRRSLTLVGQLEHLREALGDDADIRGVRIWDGRWSQQFTDAYRVMDAAEFRYSVSYEPARDTPPGFLFGTCQPFRPVDTNGLPFRLREVPVCFRDPRTEAELALFESVLRRASEEAWAVHLLTSADSFHQEPDLAAFDVWRDALRYAEAHDMWVGGAGELVSFWRERGNAEVRVISHEVTARDAGGRATAVDYIVEVETRARDLALLVPSQFAGLQFEQATRGGRDTEYRRMADRIDTATTRHLGADVHLLPINPGFTTVGLRYTR